MARATTRSYCFESIRQRLLDELAELEHQRHQINTQSSDVDERWAYRIYSELIDYRKNLLETLFPA